MPGPKAALPALPTTTARRPATGITDLPTELLAGILYFIDGPAPSDARLRDQPLEGFLKSDAKDLKAASLVCRRWRAASLSILFRHVLWSVDRWDLFLAGQEGDVASAVPLFSFLRDNRLGGAVRTVTMLVGDSSLGFYNSRAPGPSTSVGRRAEKAGWAEQAGWLGLRMAPGSDQESATYGEDNNWLWRLVFGVVDPLRFTIVASPRMLTSLMSRMLFVGDAWGFRVPYHILSLSRRDRHPSALALPSETASDKGKEAEKEEASADVLDPGRSAASAPCASPTSSKRVPCDLFTIRPWTALLLNEGSSTPIYRTYEFFHKVPPSILGALLGAEAFPNDKPLMPPSVRQMDYIGIFPLSNHVNTLVLHLPRIDKLFIQLVPQNEILDDAEEMRLVARQDLWMERNTSYSLLMREMLQFPQSGNWAHLQEFESGDAADREGWEMAVEYVRLAGNGWRVAGEGVFVKGEPDATAADADDAAAADFPSDFPPELPSPISTSPPDSPVFGEPGHDSGGQQPLLSVIPFEARRI